MTALVEVINYITEAIDKKECTALTTLDLSKTFDLVGHEILLEKLQLYGFRGKQVEILRLLLGNRLQEVRWNKTSSGRKQLHKGVSQGSILGSLLFTIFINDLPYVLDMVSKCCLYADDTALVTKCTSTQNLESLRQNTQCIA